MEQVTSGMVPTDLRFWNYAIPNRSMTQKISYRSIVKFWNYAIPNKSISEAIAEILLL